MKKIFKRTMSIIVASAVLMMNAPKISIANALVPATTVPKNIFALKADLDTTWKKDGTGTLDDPGGTNQYVLFGSYPQIEITDIIGLTENVDYAVLNERYFRIEPLKWRILANNENSDGKLFLLSDSCIDANKPFLYNNGDPFLTNATWQNSDLRKWLNSTASGSAEYIVCSNTREDGLGDASTIPSNKYSAGFWDLISGKFSAANGFLQSAFTISQQNKISAETIYSSYCETTDYMDYMWNSVTTEGQKIFVLSSDDDYNNVNNCELRNTNYGFSSYSDNSPARQFKITDYAVCGGANYMENFGCSLLTRTSMLVKYVKDTGLGTSMFLGWDSFSFTSNEYGYVYTCDLGNRDGGSSVAPALKMDMSTATFASAATAASASGFEMISTNPAMTLRFDNSGTDLANTQITKTGNKVYYTNAPAGSSLVVAATNSNGASYQYSETLSNGGEGIVDLSSKTGFVDGMAYEAWIESDIDGLLYATAPAVEVVQNLVSITLPQLVQTENGTAIEDFGLPAEVGMVTGYENVNGTGSATVSWNVDSGIKALDGSAYNYDMTKKEQQIFTIDGSIILPTGVTNTSNISTDIKIYVVVLAAGVSVPADETILVSIIPPDSIVKAHGASADVAGLGLPSTVKINAISLTSAFDQQTQSVTRVATTNEVSCTVAWDLSNISSLYDPNKEEQQMLTINGNVTLPEGISNPSELELKTTSIVVILAKAYTPPTALEFVNISIPELITKPNGTPKAVTALGLPTSVEIETGPITSPSKTTVNVTWNLDAVTYDASLKTQQVLEINGEVTLPESVKTSTGVDTMKVKMYVVVLAASVSSSTSTTPSSSNNTNSTSSTSSNSGPVFPKSVNQTQESSDSGDIFEQWVQVNFGGNQNHKFGIRAPKGVIEPGSTFYAEIIGSENEKYSDYANALDKDVSVENVEFLNLEILKPDGTTKYTELSSSVKIFAQWPEGWDRNDQLMLKLMSGTDIQRTFIEFNDIDGASYASYEFTGFSPYALIDKLTEKEAKELWWNQNKYWIISLWVILVLAVVATTGYFTFRYYKKISKKM